ncbi:MAG TPA: hypothetical protein VF190_01380, partial [Rhodothermales bacterium]
MLIPEGPRTTTSLRARGTPLADPAAQLRVLDDVMGRAIRRSFDDDLEAAGWPSLRPQALEIFQINLGKLCNMTCRHCHVDAGPDRVHEMMDPETVERCLSAIDRS